jgi:hypothetical protein
MVTFPKFSTPHFWTCQMKVVPVDMLLPKFEKIAIVGTFFFWILFSYFYYKLYYGKKTKSRYSYGILDLTYVLETWHVYGT